MMNGSIGLVIDNLDNLDDGGSISLAIDNLDDGSIGWLLTTLMMALFVWLIYVWALQ
jgi:hypothetical protein